MHASLNRSICPNQLELYTNDIDLKKLQPYSEFALDNGLKTTVFFSESTELIKLDFIFEAGSYWQTKVFEASFTNYLLTEGSSKRSAKEIAEFLDLRGAYLEKNVEKEIAVLTAYFLKKYSEDILSLLYEIIYDPAFAEHELEVYTQKRKQQFLIESQKVNFIAQTRFSEMLFGENHPYGKFGKLDDFENLSTRDLKSFHEKFYKKNPMHIVVSGHVNNEFLNLLNQYFGIKRDFITPIDSFTGIIPSHDPIQSFIPMPHAVQSAVRVGKISIDSSHQDFPMLMVLNTLLGGYFGSRLMKNIREEKGYTYGIYSLLHSFRKSGMFFITAEVNCNVVDLAIKEIMYELKRLRTEPVSQEELNLVKNYLIGEFIRSMDGVFELSERYKSLLQLSRKQSFYQNCIGAIADATPEILQSTAQKYLHEESMIKLSVGAENN